MPQTLWRDPQIEEAPRNLLLQSRCGNRMALLFHDSRVELDISYKPNALRRRDLAARIFSGRDIWTNLFRSAVIPDLGHGDVERWGYDPFDTSLGLRYGTGARNVLRLLALPEENAFAVSARAPLTLVLEPHRTFEDRGDGCFVERFVERGEDIVSFVSYPSRALSRLRDLHGGGRALQLLEDDVIIIGGEESLGQVERAHAALRGLDAGALARRVEEQVGRELAPGRIVTRDAELQQVIDLNRRASWGGLDAGGACFGALNRIYHLVWVRDGAIAAALFAQAGTPCFVRAWAPFLLAHPSRPLGEDGRRHPEFGQLVGTRWSKSEDDGVYYAVWTAFARWQATGDPEPLHEPEFAILLAAIERHIASRFDAARGLMGSDTLGEESLHSSPYYGYDVVNGRLSKITSGLDQRRPIQRAYSLYHALNTVNELLMASVLLAERPDLAAERTERWLRLADVLCEGVLRTLGRSDGTLASILLVYQDGTEEVVPFGKGSDYWETAFAVSQGPFMPLAAQQLATAEVIVRDWASYHPYGFCPWNELARTLHDHGRLRTGAWRALLAQELREALMTTQKYPMPGVLTEYAGWVEGWRGLPISASTLVAAACGQLLLAQPQGLAVRGGSGIEAVEGYRWRLSRLSVTATGVGEGVERWTLDGAPFSRCLLVPLDRLQAQAHAIVVERTDAVPVRSRLVASDGQLRSWREDAGGCSARFSSAATLRVRGDGPLPQGLRCANAEGMTVDAKPTIVGEGWELRLPPGRIEIAFS